MARYLCSASARFTSSRRLWHCSASTKERRLVRRLGLGLPFLGFPHAHRVRIATDDRCFLATNFGLAKAFCAGRRRPKVWILVAAALFLATSFRVPRWRSARLRMHNARVCCQLQPPTSPLLLLGGARAPYGAAAPRLQFGCRDVLGLLAGAQGGCSLLPRALQHRRRVPRLPELRHAQPRCQRPRQLIHLLKQNIQKHRDS